MSNQSVGSKMIKEIFNLNGSAVPNYVRADEQMLLWACSQAISEISSGNPVSATLILDAVLLAMLPQTYDTTEEEVKGSEDPRWSVFYSPDYEKAKEHLSGHMQRVFYGFGGTTGTIESIVDF